MTPDVTVDQLARALWFAYQQGRYTGSTYEEYWPEDLDAFTTLARSVISTGRHPEDTTYETKALLRERK